MWPWRFAICYTAGFRNRLKGVDTVWYKRRYIQKEALLLMDKVLVPIIIWNQDFAPDLMVLIMKPTRPEKDDYEGYQTRENYVLQKPYEKVDYDQHSARTRRFCLETEKVISHGSTTTQMTPSTHFCNCTSWSRVS